MHMHFSLAGKRLRAPLLTLVLPMALIGCATQAPELLPAIPAQAIASPPAALPSVAADAPRPGYGPGGAGSDRSCHGRCGAAHLTVR